MIGRGEITKAAQSDGVDAQTVERDYVLAHVAAAIGREGGEQLVLKGGTCLRLAHYRDYRYSADLDYSLQAIDVAGALDVVERALEACHERAELAHLRLADEPELLRIEYVGPLGAKIRTIKLDLTDDELVLEHADLPMIVGWRDLPDEVVLCAYTLTEVCAEKLRCVIQRRQCRDVYDLWALFDDRGGADFFEAWHRFERKARHSGLDPARFFDRWDDGVEWYGARWESEMEDYLGEECPDFDSVARVLGRRVTELRDYLA
ncbi:MAG: nucleotidyl transferase AbiEii/AbiGii toxin family protein [Acidimicrobiia bacterium]|nr:nucleotidyl transferase AbiEii/AbiGii toxin family protein [Acidimicrobiia bacterium]